MPNCSGPPPFISTSTVDTAPVYLVNAYTGITTVVAAVCSPCNRAVSRDGCARHWEGEKGRTVGRRRRRTAPSSSGDELGAVEAFTAAADVCKTVIAPCVPPARAHVCVIYGLSILRSASAVA